MKKVSVGAVKGLLKEARCDDTFQHVVHTEKGNITATFRTKLSLEEESMFIRRVMSVCFDAEGEYRPEYVDPMIKVTILQLCTNLPTLTLKNEQGEDGARLMDLPAMQELYRAMGVDEIENEAFRAMKDDLFYCTYEAIKWKKNRILQSGGGLHDGMREFGRAARAVRRAAETIGNMTERNDYGELLQYAKKLTEATDGLKENDLAREMISLYREENGIAESRAK